MLSVRFEILNLISFEVIGSLKKFTITFGHFNIGHFTKRTFIVYQPLILVLQPLSDFEYANIFQLILANCQYAHTIVQSHADISF